jgi:hypothetical protein
MSILKPIKPLRAAYLTAYGLGIHKNAQLSETGAAATFRCSDITTEIQPSQRKSIMR